MIGWLVGWLVGCLICLAPTQDNYDPEEFAADSMMYLGYVVPEQAYQSLLETIQRFLANAIVRIGGGGSQQDQVLSLPARRPSCLPASLRVCVPSQPALHIPVATTLTLRLSVLLVFVFCAWILSGTVW